MRKLFAARHENGRGGAWRVPESRTLTTQAPLSGKVRVPGSVFALGLVSLFADVSSEMVYPLLPFFLKGVLGAGTVAIGLIEGIAESTATVVNLFSGWLSDRLGKRKGLAVIGYGLAAVMRPVIGVAGTWQQVLAARFADRVGKGIRTAPRDALVAQAAPEEIRGRAFGIQRALDHTGAILGPLAAMGLLFLLGSPLGGDMGAIPEFNYRLIFLLAFIPGAFAVLILWLGVKEPARGRPAAGRGLPFGSAPFSDAQGKQGKPSISLRALKGPFGAFCLVATLFAMGNSSNMFLLLRAQDVGVSIGLVPAVYVLLYLSAAAFSTPAGIVSDHLGRRRMLILGYLVSAGVYCGFALARSPLSAWVLFALYGLYIAMTDGMQRAYAADLAPKEVLGTAMGTFHALTGLALLPASIIAGALWNLTPGHEWPFWFGAITGLAAALLLTAVPFTQRAPGSKIGFQ